MKPSFGTPLAAALALVLCVHPTMAVNDKGIIRNHNGSNGSNNCWFVQSNEKIGLKPCDMADPSQEFWFGASNKQIQHSGKCVDGPAGGQIGLAPCNNANSKRWTFNGASSNAHTHTDNSMCAHASNSKVDMVTCNGSPKGADPEIEFIFAPAPTKAPTASPTKNPTNSPTASPTKAPTAYPTKTPTAPPTKTPTKAPSRNATASGDPHFVTFSGKKYDFHGGCDLVLLQNKGFNNGLGMDVHIRTEIKTWWSYIKTASVRIGRNTLEVAGGIDGGKCWINGEEGGKLEDRDIFEISGFRVVHRQIISKQKKYRIDLGQGEAMSIETFGSFVRVNIKAMSNRFEGSRGLMGEYPSGKMVARDGSKVMDDADSFGKEWQVQETEALLFHSIEGVQYPTECAMPLHDASAGRKQRRRLGEVLITKEEASVACAHANEEEQDACIFDVLATNDKSLAGSY